MQTDITCTVAEKLLLTMGVWKPGNRLLFSTGNPDVYKKGLFFSAVCVGSNQDIYRGAHLNEMRRTCINVFHAL